MAHEFGYIVRVESGLAQPCAISGPQIVPDQTFYLRFSTSSDKGMLDVGVGPARLL
jgi:hypothetical protein